VAAQAGQAAPSAPVAAASQPAAAQAEGKSADAQAPAAPAFSVAAAPAPTPRENATVTLSGPPTAWRQTLQEALGERLNLQLGKNAEQAVIRLEPPMLGRVEISIRHAAGSLEVNITATHGEVLRQLNTVSENLRNDLAGRQYSDVSVNVSQAPRAQATAQSGTGFSGDAQGRGRQQEQQDQQTRQPGAALADAHQPNAAFSLSGRA
jgi:flagellar hook-length control protein FliK